MFISHCAYVEVGRGEVFLNAAADDQAAVLGALQSVDLHVVDVVLVRNFQVVVAGKFTGLSLCVRVRGWWLNVSVEVITILFRHATSRMAASVRRRHRHRFPLIFNASLVFDSVSTRWRKAEEKNHRNY